MNLKPYNCILCPYRVRDLLLSLFAWDNVYRCSLMTSDQTVVKSECPLMKLEKTQKRKAQQYSNKKRIISKFHKLK